MPSLKQLLVAGSSISGLKTGAAPYRTADQNYLSRLGPLAMPVRRVLRREPVEAVESGLGAQGRESGRSVGKAHWAETVSEASSFARSSEVGQGEERRSVSKPGPVPTALPATARTGWSVRSLLNFNFFRAERRNSRTQRLIQTELSLENVRVIRNDLVEADLEVVECLGAPEGNSVRVAQSSLCEPPHAQSSWVSGNWMGSSQGNRPLTPTVA